MRSVDIGVDPSSGPDASIETLLDRPGHEVAGLLRARQVTSLDLTRAALARIAAIDPILESYALVAGERALAQADAADRDLAGGIVRGPLHGVPIAVKDLCDTADLATAAGFAARANHIPEQDSTVVRRLAESGTVLLGKLRMTEGAFAVHNDGKQAPRNPWNPSYWSGHSSSGSGVATAAGLAFATIGSDTGGSIRYPASANGVVGLKPTWGRISRFGVFPMAPSMDHLGPMTRTVRDAALVLGIVAGADAADASSARQPIADYAAGLDRPLAGARIAIDRTILDGPLDGEVANTLASVLATFEAGGAQIVETRFPVSQAALDAWETICGVEAALVHREARRRPGAGYGEAFNAFLEDGESRGVGDLAAAMLTRNWLGAAIDAALLNADVFLLPVQRWSPPSLDDLQLRGADVEFVSGLLWFTGPTDVSGHPSVVLPGGISGAGVPIGFQLVARHFDEATLLGIGAAYEREVGGFRAPSADRGARRR
ncbi:amidase [Chelatococcus asaccharovorans]|uniref:amidase n=1 Tax=Chelatococcus asaccharovorans TaxID=28210 RepID=UPI00224C7ABA|nr:amidase [Chelatococcus asaccharovorans]CAH1659642.1 putative amidase AmiD [Chelatococcus asaccharovorans]CAH1684115.1 putative amidase AmiD [Chelatococcus asaccharovorans]